MVGEGNPASFSIGRNSPSGFYEILRYLFPQFGGDPIEAMAEAIA